MSYRLPTRFPEHACLNPRALPPSDAPRATTASFFRSPALSALFTLLALSALVLSSCTRDRFHVLRVSVRDQQLALFTKGTETARFPISTSKFGLGDRPGSNCTPIGTFEVARKIGDAQPLGMKFKDRRPTGEIVPVNAPGRDPIVTRILWLRGLEACNQNAFERMIYIHGTPEEAKLGTPASFGCVRMRSKDILAVFNTVGSGARVIIDPGPLPEAPLQKTRVATITPAGDAL
jgi:hypothetical protein